MISLYSANICTETTERLCQFPDPDPGKAFLNPVLLSHCSSRQQSTFQIYYPEYLSLQLSHPLTQPTYVPGSGKQSFQRMFYNNRIYLEASIINIIYFCEVSITLARRPDVFSHVGKPILITCVLECL